LLSPSGQEAGTSITAGLFTTAGWWIHFKAASPDYDTVFQIPDQGCHVAVDEHEQFNRIRVLTIKGEELSISSGDVQIDLHDLQVPFDALATPNNIELMKELRMHSDRDERIKAPVLTEQLKDMPVPEHAGRGYTFFQDDESPDFRWLRQLQARGVPEHELMQYCRQRMTDILNKIQIYEPWYSRAQVRKVLDEEQHNFEVLWKFVKGLTGDHSISQSN
jgi:hypothetical protein